MCAPFPLILIFSPIISLVLLFLIPSFFSSSFLVQVGFDPALAAASVTKVALAAPEEGSGGNGDEREELGKLIDVKEVLMKLGDGDNKKWKDRKEAMDKVTEG